MEPISPLILWLVGVGDSSWVHTRPSWASKGAPPSLGNIVHFSIDNRSPPPLGSPPIDPLTNANATAIGPPSSPVGSADASPAYEITGGTVTFAGQDLLAPGRPRSVIRPSPGRIRTFSFTSVLFFSGFFLKSRQRRAPIFCRDFRIRFPPLFPCLSGSRLSFLAKRLLTQRGSIGNRFLVDEGLPQPHPPTVRVWGQRPPPLSVEDRATLGLFIGFQHPIEVPGVCRPPP